VPCVSLQSTGAGAGSSVAKQPTPRARLAVMSSNCHAAHPAERQDASSIPGPNRQRKPCANCHPRACPYTFLHPRKWKFTFHFVELADSTGTLRMPACPGGRFPYPNGCAAGGRTLRPSAPARVGITCASHDA
jgi:hypothetical protein